MLREMCGAGGAVGALSQAGRFTGLALAVGEPAAATTGAAFGGFVAARSATGRRSAGSSSAPARVSWRPRASRPARPARKLDVMLDIDLPLIVRFGRTEMSLKALTALGPGSIVDLGRSPDDPVELLVSDQVIAHGEVVIVGGNYGVRITDVVSAARTRPGVEDRRRDDLRIVIALACISAAADLVLLWRVLAAARRA